MAVVYGDFDWFLVAFEDGFYSAVGEVADPAFDVETVGLAFGALPEVDALDSAGYKYVCADFHSVTLQLTAMVQNFA